MKVAVVTHVYTTGPAQDLRDYLVGKKIESVYFIGHPLFFDHRLHGSGIEIYNKGIKIKEKYFQIKRTPFFISVIKDIWLTCMWIIKSGQKFDLFVGSNNLNAFAGIILRSIGKVKKVVYYVIDYNPHRFNNKIYNSIYIQIDQFCVKNADETWNLSSRMAWARKKYFGFTGGNQIEAPIGVWPERINLNTKKIPYSLVYMGHVTKKQGIQNVIQSIPQIIKKIPKFKLFVLGGGEYLDELELMTRKLKISNHVKFTGFIKDHHDIESLLPKYSLAIAPYEKYDDQGNLSFTYFTDPGKLKMYLACGLPILLSDVPSSAKRIESEGMGKIIRKELAEEVIELFNNQKKIEIMTKNVRSHASDFSWPHIFSKLLSSFDNKSEILRP